MNIVLPGLTPDRVIRRVEEIRDLRAYSIAALRNMHDYQVAKRARLDKQTAYLNAFMNYEVDIYEQMKLAQRLTKVERNIERTEERIRRLRGELLSRTLSGKRDST